MSTLSQDPLTKNLVKFCIEPNKIKVHKMIDFKDIISLIALSEDFKRYSIEAYHSNISIKNSTMQGLSNNLWHILFGLKESHYLPALLLFLSSFVDYLTYDNYFREAASHYGKDFVYTLLKNDLLKHYYANKNYTDLLINSIRINTKNKRNSETSAFIDSFLENLSQTFYEYRKELYKQYALKIQPYKQELIANVMHPARLQKMLDSGMDLDEVLNLYIN